MKSETNVEDLEEFAGDMIEDAFRGLNRYFEEVEEIEQKYNPANAAAATPGF